MLLFVSWQECHIYVSPKKMVLSPKCTRQKPLLPGMQLYSSIYPGEWRPPNTINRNWRKERHDSSACIWILVALDLLIEYSHVVVCGLLGYKTPVESIFQYRNETVQNWPAKTRESLLFKGK